MQGQTYAVSELGLTGRVEEGCRDHLEVE